LSTPQHRTLATRPRRLAEVAHWDMETDVAVAGFGGAGACAALEAHDQGAQVLLFELASDSGGSTKLSSAEIYMGGGTRVQKACGIDDTVEDMFRYLMLANGPLADEAKIRAYCEGSVAHFDWLVRLGAPYKDSVYPHRAIMALTDDCLLFTGSEKAWPFAQAAQPAPRGHNLQVEGDNGGALFARLLRENVEKRGIGVHFEARVLTLVTDDEGAVHGLVVRIDQRERTVRARRGVVLCCGGFVMNEAMLKQHAPVLLAGSQPIGNPGDTGTGILMGLGAGGNAINMHEGFISLPYYPPAELTRGILVNAAGQRFINEDCYHGRVGYYCLQQPDRRVYLVASAADFEDYQKTSYLGAKFAGTAEKSVAELEAELQLPEGALQATVEIYNRNAREGCDPLFHKSAEWLRPLELPLAALDCTPGHGAFYPFFTLGGLDTLPGGEVLSPERNVIPGLYAAGRTACGVPRTAGGYSSGISVGDATFSGRMAGRSAALR
jgi:succinate dehydrogenase/fumarate reductase flavoprotein subunit